MKHLEDQEQRALIRWADLAPLPAAPDVLPTERVGDYLAAVPNGLYAGGKKTRTGVPIAAARAVGLGLRSGFPDLLFELPRGGYFGLRIELKRQRRHFPSERAATKAVSPKQQAWVDRLNRVGYLAVVCYGADEAKEAINAYLSRPPTVACECSI